MYKSRPSKVGGGRSFSAFTKVGLYLVIVESPSKCGSIEKYLGSNYQVIASCGHIVELNSLKDIDTKNEYKPTFRVKYGKAAHIEYMRSAIIQFSPENIMLATDSDREGEAIAYHVADTFNLSIDKTKRIIFNEITYMALQNSVIPENMRIIDMSIVRAQQARQILDLTIGFRVSPALWKHVYYSKTNALSAGRCQTPSLRLIYENHLESQKSVPDTRYKIMGSFLSPPSLQFDLNVEMHTDTEVRGFLAASKVYLHKLSISECRSSISPSPLPMNTARLLQSASNSLHLSPKSTMQLAQILYQEGRITYMRTESRKYSSDFLRSAELYITGTFHDVRYVGIVSNLVNSGSNDPHEAVRVTDLSVESISGDNSKLCALYKLIWRHSLESCMSPAVMNIYDVFISAPDAYKYRSDITIPEFLGWTRVAYKTDSEITSSISSATGLLHRVRCVGDNPIKFNAINAIMVYRDNHRYFNESSLIQRLEELGIGRPSTYSMFVETIQERGYVSKRDLLGDVVSCIDFRLEYNDMRECMITESMVDKIFGVSLSRLIIEPIGILCIEFLTSHFSEIFDYGYTKQLEEKLDTIASTLDYSDWYTVCECADTDITRQLSQLSALKKVAYPLDKDHFLVFRQYGACILHTYINTVGKKSREYFPVKRGFVLDMNILRQGKYSVLDLREDAIVLGEYDGKPVRVLNGKYGAYVENGSIRKNIRDSGICKSSNTSVSNTSVSNTPVSNTPVSNTSVSNTITISDTSVSDAITISDTSVSDAITISDAISIITGCVEKSTLDTRNKAELRKLNATFSIRKGRFGHYIYHRSSVMSSPLFISLKSCPYKYLDCPVEDMILWIESYISSSLPKVPV
jgi:DNA topoisomerase-1